MRTSKVISCSQKAFNKNHKIKNNCSSKEAGVSKKRYADAYACSLFKELVKDVELGKWHYNFPRKCLREAVKVGLGIHDSVTYLKLLSQLADHDKYHKDCPEAVLLKQAYEQKNVELYKDQLRLLFFGKQAKAVLKRKKFS